MLRSELSVFFAQTLVFFLCHSVVFGSEWSVRGGLPASDGFGGAAEMFGNIIDGLTALIDEADGFGNDGSVIDTAKEIVGGKSSNFF